MDATGLAEGRFLSPPSLGKAYGLAGPWEGDPCACLDWVQGDTAVLPVRDDRGLDRRAGDGEVDGTSAQQPPRLREYRLTKGAEKILLGESGAANPRLGLLLRCGGGPAHDWKTPSRTTKMREATACEHKMK
jgi:hypothetical protein